MSATLQVAIPVALSLPLAMAILAMARAAFGKTVFRLHPDSAIYALGAFITSWTVVIMVYTLGTSGPGANAGINLTFAFLLVYHLLETLREHIPIGWPGGYCGG